MNRFIELENDDGNIIKQKMDFPEFMRYTRKISYTKNGKEIEKDIVNEQKNRLNNRICSDLICPMNALQIVLGGIKRASTRDTIPTEEFIINVKGDTNRRQMAKIIEYAKELDLLSKTNMSDQDIIAYSERFEMMLFDLKKMKISSPKTMNRLIVSAFNIKTAGGKSKAFGYTRNLLNLLFNMNEEAFLKNFKKYTDSEKKS